MALLGNGMDCYGRRSNGGMFFEPLLPIASTLRGLSTVPSSVASQWFIFTTACQLVRTLLAVRQLVTEL